MRNHEVRNTMNLSISEPTVRFPAWDWLDPDHLKRIYRVERCDASIDRRSAAERELSALTTETTALHAERTALGSNEHLDAIRRSGWYPYRTAIDTGSRILMIVDAVLWQALLVSAGWAVATALGHGTTLAFVIAVAIAVPLALGLAKASRALGRQLAVAKLTDPASVGETLDRQVRVAGHLGLAALACLFALAGIFVLAPAGAAPWVQTASEALSFAANVLLGLSAGIGANAGYLLGKSDDLEAIDVILAMKERTARRLMGYLIAFVVLFLFPATVSSPARAAPQVWVVAIDVTASMDPEQRLMVIATFLDSALERARVIGVDYVLVASVSDQDFLPDETLISVPPALGDTDCGKARIALSVSKSWVAFAPGRLIGAKQAAVSDCRAREEIARQRSAAEERRFLERLRQAMQVVPRADVRTRIVPLVQNLVARPNTRAVELITDLCDDSGIPPSRITVPPGVQVTVILTRPDPRRRSPTLADTSRAAARWRTVPGVRVVTPTEYTMDTASRGEH